MLENCRPEVRHAMRNITNVFAGYDGCISFARFNVAIEQLDKQAVNGDDAAGQLLDIVVKFNRLIEGVLDGPVKE